jgi:hypothetical protein
MTPRPGRFYWAGPDEFSSQLRLEYGWLLREGIDTLARLGGRFFGDDELGEAGHQEGSDLLEFLVAHVCERLEDVPYILSGQLARMLLGDFPNEF